MNTRSVAAIGAVAVAALLTTGCITSRKTTTARTAIEQQLLSESAARTVAQWSAPSGMEGMSFHVNRDNITARDREVLRPPPFDRYMDNEYLLSEIDLYLLRAGLTEGDAEGADLRIEPRVSSAAIDDWDLIIGIPGQEVSLGPIGFTIPELALFKRDKQMGRNRMGLHAIRSEDGALMFESPVRASETTFVRHKILFFFSWTWSDMAAPWGGSLSDEYKQSEKEWKGMN